MYRLKFKEQIAPTAAKPISVNDLLKRLKTLATELEKLQQETVDRDDLVKIGTQLVSVNLIQHKNKGITAYAACCIADILRLCVPDAPYSQTQLRSIFECFVKQLRGLENVEGPYYHQHFYLLESLATVESVVLLGDIEKGDDLTIDIFQCFFDITSTNNRRQNVSEHMISIMTQLILESPQVPADVLQILLAQLLRPSKAKRVTNDLKDVAYDMTKAVFANCADRLQRDVCQYFTEIILNANQEETDKADQNDAIDRLTIIHNLVYELFECAPSTLQNVIPQLESELNVENQVCRRLATKTISAMLGSTNGATLIKQYPSTYKAWQIRRKDTSATIRAQWLEGIDQILANGNLIDFDVGTICITGLTALLSDTDERVRITACNVVGQLPYRTAKERLTVDLIQIYFARCRDRKPHVQEAAFQHIGKLFSVAYTDIQNGDEKALHLFAPIVNCVLRCLFVNDMGLNVMIVRTLYEDILDFYELDDQIRATRILTVLKLADLKSRNAFFAIVGAWQKGSAQRLEHFLKCCDKYNGGVMDKHAKIITEKLEEGSTLLAQQSPDPAITKQHLLNFAKANDRRCYKLMRECISPANDFRTVRKLIKESLKRASQISSQVEDTFRAILSRASYQCCNRSVVTPISTIGRQHSDKYLEVSELLLGEIARVHPEVYKSHIGTLVSDLIQNPLDVPPNTMKALARLARSHPHELPDDDDFLAAMGQVLDDGSPAQAKQAVTIISCLPDKALHIINDRLNSIVDNLAYGAEQFLTKLAIIAQTSLVAADILETRADNIAAFCIEELLGKNRNIIEEGDQEYWIEDDSVPEECLAKCYAVRILGNRLRAHHSASMASEIAKPVLEIIRQIIKNIGAYSAEDQSPFAFRSRLELEASKMLLKLAAFAPYELLITPHDFIEVAFVAQDMEPMVRKSFLGRLQKSLASKALPPRWYSIMFLATRDVADDIRVDMERRLTLLASLQQKDYLLELMMPRLIHLLAHHERFLDGDNEDTDIVDFSNYFSSYFDAVATADNLGLIYHLCQRVKQMVDIVEFTHNNPEIPDHLKKQRENIYILSDIAQVVLATKAEHKNWPLLAYPKKLKLPADLYEPIRDNSGPDSIQRRAFLSDEQRSLVKQHIERQSRSGRAPKAPLDDGEVILTKKRSKAVPKKAKSVKKARTRNGSAKATSSERRSSTRAKTMVKYEESEDMSNDEESEELSDSSFEE